MNIVQRLVLVVLLVAIPLGLLQAYSVREEQGEQRAEIAQVALRTAHRAAAEQQRIVDGARQLLAALAQIPAVRERAVDRCSLILRRLQAQFPMYIAIGVADPSGRIWCSSAKPGTDVSDRPYFKRALATHRFTTGGYVVGRLWNRRSLNFNLPFEDSSGRVIGVIVAGFDLDRLAADMARAQLPQASRLVIVGPDRRILVDLPDSARVGTLLAPQFQPMFDARRAGTTQAQWLDGSDRLIAFVPPANPGMPFLVAVGIDHASAMAPVRGRSRHDVTVLVSTVVAALVLAWWFATRFVRRPIERLAASMRAWNAGDVTVRVGPLNPGSEFDDLARAFDVMAEEVEARQRRLYDTLESTSDIVLMIARDWTVTFMNEKARTLLDGIDVLGNHLWQVFPEVPKMPVGIALSGAMIDRLPLTIAYELQPFGHFETYIFPDPEEGLTLFIRDVTERHHAQEALRELALKDTLTGLPNRAHVREIAEREVAAGRLVAVGLVDLDGFKHVNDRFGHHAGDDILRIVAKRLSACVEGRGVVARVGGDEFLALLYDGAADATAHGQALLACLELEPLFARGRRHPITASCGIVEVQATAPVSLEELLANADLALYCAKAAGGRTCHTYTPLDRDEYESRRRLEEELSQATALGEFELHYQPQVSFSDGKLVGAEALLRWRHPRHGLLEPASFIEILGLSRHAQSVGDWVLDAACRQAGIWWRAGHRLRVAVNLFADQLRSADLVERVECALRDHGLPGEALELELTENIALDAEQGTGATFQALRDLGVSLAFDDFGTGFASLTTLKDFRVDRLKLDRGFVDQLPQDEHDEAIVEAVLALARTLELEVIAEGVETAVQEAYLRSRGCHEGQGFRYGQAMPVEEFNATLLPPVAAAPADS